MLQRLSSGKRINSARDDAAGLAVATRLRAQVSGFEIANRNVLDAQSMLQTSEGALGAISENLQRMRELALQAVNGTVSRTDREAIQAEVGQLKAEIARISGQTRYNGINLLDRDAAYGAADFAPGTTFERIDFSALQGDELITAQKQVIVDQLRNRWLAEAETMIADLYGLTGDGATLTVFIDEPPVAGTEGFAAYVSSQVDPASGLGENIELRINLQSFLPLNPPISGPVGDPIDQFNAFGLGDRTIVHEMVHAIGRRTINTGSSRWFEEGLADFIHGADERVVNYLASQGGAGDAPTDDFVGNNVTNRDALAVAIGDGTGGVDAWNTAEEYASSYVAVRYLDQAIRDTGGDGIRDVLDKLKADPSTVTVSAAIAAVLADLNAENGATALNVAGFTGPGFTDEASFLSAFTAVGDAGGGGSQFIRDGMLLLNEDTGSVAGSDVGAGPSLDAIEVVADENEYRADPLDNWNVVFPDGFEPPVQTVRLGTERQVVTIQSGTAIGDVLEVELSGANLNALRLEGLDVSEGDPDVLALIDRAIDHVAVERGLLGASMNRLAKAFDANAGFRLNLSAALSRVEDADYATEITRLSTRQVLQQAGVAVLTQANAAPRLVLQLLQA